jgi:hypothetical protein
MHCRAIDNTITENGWRKKEMGRENGKGETEEKQISVFRFHYRFRFSNN